MSSACPCPRAAHELDYRHFEGVLVEGQYGAGPVMVWDEGTYVPERETGKGVPEEVTERAEAEAEMQSGFAAGMLKLRLYGYKRVALVCRRPTRGLGEKESWLRIRARRWLYAARL